VIKALELKPEASQRELSKDLGVSLGSVNYCLKALVGKGLVKIENFNKADSKHKYVYILTPKGLIEKAEITYSFLQRKKQEYALLHEEIRCLQAELQASKYEKARR
jgi:EPS-associated MarR family transcriptional regulator